MRAFLFLSAFISVSFIQGALPKDYETWTGCQKSEYLWTKKIVPSEYKDVPGMNFGGYAAFLNFMKTPDALLHLKKTFDHTSDEIPADRRKFIHPFGSVVKVIWKGQAGGGFTGLFSEKEVCGLARLSLGGPPLVGGYVPGMAVKLFIDKKPSLNLHVLNSLQGKGDDTNFFSKSFSNVLPEIEVSVFDPLSFVLKTLEAWFARAKPNPRELSVKPLAETDSKGVRVAASVAPWKLTFVPGKKAKEVFENRRDEDEDLRTTLGTIPSGTVLYDVFAYQDKKAAGKWVASLVTDGKFVASQYGDETLFFQHIRK